MTPVTPRKFMYLLWREEGEDPATLATQLHGEALRDRLWAAGAERYQVNIDDEHVANAQMRLSTFESAPGAVVSVWSWEEGDPTAVTELLAGLAGRVAGWEVDEARQKEPPVTPEGQRAPWLANMALLRVPDRLTHAEWLRIWKDDHTELSMAVQDVHGYIQNAVLRPITAEAPEVAALVEELFPLGAIDDIAVQYGAAGDKAELKRRFKAMMESTSRFGANENVDVIPSSRYLYSAG